MSSISLDNFQDQVSDLLLRHRSLLDILSKLTQSNGSVHRSVIKAITECGCIEAHATKQPYLSEMSREEAKEKVTTHVSGQLCEHCQEMVRSELGKNLFYLAALCNVLDLNLQSVVAEEAKKCTTLGFFNLS